MKSAAQDLDTSPFEEPSYEKVERGIPGPWERAADRAEAKARRVERCPETSQEGARCIYDEGHGGKHFAKDSFSYYSWKRESPSSSASDREVRAWVWSFLICYAVGLLGAFGWGRHWNAYLCLLLTLGSAVLWATFATAWRNRIGR